MEIVTTPTEEMLRRSISQCTSRFIVSSPYITRPFLELMNSLASQVQRILLTRTDLRDFALGVSDLETLCDMASIGIDVRSLTRLHAKVYIFDSNLALVTSANATDGGLRRNWECGILTDESTIVDKLAKLALSGFGSPEPPLRWRAEELEALKSSVNVISESLQGLPPSKFVYPDRLKVNITDPQIESRFLNTFDGWIKLVLEGVLKQTEDDFNLNQLFSVCNPIASVQYPRNRHVRDKLRQQLQILRDLGLVEFQGWGKYRRMISSEKVQ